jgi:hypothetical protein
VPCVRASALLKPRRSIGRRGVGGRLWAGAARRGGTGARLPPGRPALGHARAAPAAAGARRRRVRPRCGAQRSRSARPCAVRPLGPHWVQAAARTPRALPAWRAQAGVLQADTHPHAPVLPHCPLTPLPSSCCRPPACRAYLPSRAWRPAPPTGLSAQAQSGPPLASAAGSPGLRPGQRRSPRTLRSRAAGRGPCCGPGDVRAPPRAGTRRAAAPSPGAPRGPPHPPGPHRHKLRAVSA